MTSEEWNACADPSAMLRLYTSDEMPWPSGTPAPVVSERKLRLFACAVCLAVRGELIGGQLDAVALAERVADDHGSKRGRYELLTEARRAAGAGGWVWCATGADIAVCLRQTVCHNTAPTIPPAAQATLLKDVLGDPFRPQTCLAGHPVHGLGGLPVHCADALAIRRADGGLVIRLAEAAYSERQADGLLDPLRLAVLADALEEAGLPAEEECRQCPKWEGMRIGSGDAVQAMTTWGKTRKACVCRGTGRVSNPLLAHLRSEGPHVRGCASLDRVLGKE